VLVQQIVDAGGHCPWCGKAFNRDYTSMLVKGLQRAEESGNQFQDALEQVGDLEGLALSLDAESIISPLREALREMRKRRSPV
jgi:hypothetical protein